MSTRPMKLGASAVLVALFALAFGLTTAFASNGPTVTSGPVGWTIGAGVCADYSAINDMVGVGRIKSITTQKTNNDGTITITNTTHASGTASDGTGSYHWNYTNHYSITNSVATPLVYVGKMTDAFALTGNGPSQSHSGFFADYSENHGDNSYTLTPRPNQRGNFLTCDPL